MENSFYSRDELEQIGFMNIGENVLISRKASLYGVKQISVGSNVRVDDFCILSGNIKLENYIHIAAHTLLYGGEAGIYIDSYSTISSNGAVYAISDDYSGEYMTNPMIPVQYTNVHNESVRIGKYCIVGTGSTILPGVEIEEGVAIGAMSLVKRSLDKWTIYAGVPCKKIRKRSKKLIEYEKKIV